MLFAGILQQFAISQATLLGWNSMDGESLCADSNQGSVAHLSEVNQESITSRGEGHNLTTTSYQNRMKSLLERFMISVMLRLGFCILFDFR